MSYWLFQGNLKYYRIVAAIKDFALMPWLVTRYAKEMAIGDGVLLWIAGAGAGIYVIAEFNYSYLSLQQEISKEAWKYVRN